MTHGEGCWALGVLRVEDGDAVSQKLTRKPKCATLDVRSGKLNSGVSEFRTAFSRAHLNSRKPLSVPRTSNPTFDNHDHGAPKLQQDVQRP